MSVKESGREPLRILFTSLGYKPAYRLGGPVLSVSAMAERLVRRGHEVVVFTSDSNLEEDLRVPLNQPVQVDGVEVWYFSRGPLEKRLFRAMKSIGVMYTPQMRQPLRRYLPAMDLVHTHNPFSYSTYAAGKASRDFRKPLFFQQRGVLDPQRLRFRSLRKRMYIDLIVRPLMRQAATLIALTQAEVNSYQALGLETPCRIVPNGIEVDAYRQRGAGAPATLWNIPPQAQVILFLGRMHPIKGADRVLEAFFQIQALAPEAVLVMAGPDEWGWGGKFRQLAAGAGLSQRVLFPGMVSGEAKLDLLARADLFCLPSDAEGFSMAVLESLASGTPVLLSPGCHFPEVEPAGAGRVVAPTPPALTAAMAELLGQPQRLQAMGTLGIEFVRRNYSWEHVTDKLLTVYHEGIQRHRESYARPAAALSR